MTRRESRARSPLPSGRCSVGCPRQLLPPRPHCPRSLGQIGTLELQKLNPVMEPRISNRRPSLPLGGGGGGEASLTRTTPGCCAQVCIPPPWTEGPGVWGLQLGHVHGGPRLETERKGGTRRAPVGPRGRGLAGVHPKGTALWLRPSSEAGPRPALPSHLQRLSHGDTQSAQSPVRDAGPPGRSGNGVSRGISCLR